LYFDDINIIMWSATEIIVVSIVVILFVVGASIGGIFIYRKYQGIRASVMAGYNPATGVTCPTPGCILSSIYQWSYNDAINAGLSISPDQGQTIKCLTTDGGSTDENTTAYVDNCQNMKTRFQFQSDGTLQVVTNTDPPQLTTPAMYLGLRYNSLSTNQLYDTPFKGGASWGYDHMNFTLKSTKDDTCYWSYDPKTQLLRSLFCDAVKQQQQYVAVVPAWSKPQEYTVLQFMPYPLSSR
jgi:hypothetical protein